MADPDNRRPIASRETGWARKLTVWLAARNITPNQISQTSIAAAALAGITFYFAGGNLNSGRIPLLIAAALFCQLRLLCNLLDGMVAIEAGKATRDGLFWNEFPDRISDILIFIGMGYGVDRAALGWAAAAFAVLTAYIRELGRASGLKVDFSGPMAKPQRMALVTLAALVSIFDGVWGTPNSALIVALWAVALGTVFTGLRRARRMLKALKTRA